MALLLPVDACPACITPGRHTLTHPHRLTTEGAGVGMFAFYRCPACGHRWRTGWTLDALDRPCPGCPACNPQAGAA